MMSPWHSMGDENIQDSRQKIVLNTLLSKWAARNMFYGFKYIQESINHDKIYFRHISYTYWRKSRF